MNRKFIWGLIGLAMIIAGVIVPLWILRLISIFDYIPDETVQIFGKTIIKISAALIGFWGIILVFILKSIQSYRERTIAQIHKINLKLNNLVVKKEFEDKAKGKFIDSQIDLNEKWVNLLNKHVIWANDRIRDICYIGIIVVAIFIASILSSMAVMGISMTNKKLSNEFVEFLGVPYSYMSFPLIALIFGIIGIFIGIISIAPEKKEALSSKAKQREA
jgi:hypothetical protein